MGKERRKEKEYPEIKYKVERVEITVLPIINP